MTRSQKPWSRTLRESLSPVLLALVAIACGDRGPTDERKAAEAGDLDAQPSLRATLLLEPAVLHIGEVATVELAVVTPPEYRVLPLEPIDPPGLWLIAEHPLPTRQAGTRWLHRTRFRLRPREIGTYTWPAMTVQIEAPDGSQLSHDVEERSFEVRSVRPRFPGREEPFGLQPPTEPEPGLDRFLLGFLAGLGVAALGLGGWLATRRWSPDSDVAPEAPEVRAAEAPSADLWQWASDELDDALDALERNPRRSANVVARVVRVYMSRRFGSTTQAATTLELERHAPSLAERSLWPDFLRILHNLDDLRFQPEAASQALGAGSPAANGRIRSALEDSRALVEASLPQGSRESGR